MSTEIVEGSDPVPKESENLEPPAPEVTETNEIVEPATEEPPAEPPPTAPIPKNDPESLARYDSETVELCTAKNDEIREAEAEYHEANEHAKSLKKKWEARVADLQALIQQRRESRGKPVQPTLLDGIPTDAPEPGLGELPVDQPDPLAELWRQVPIDRIGQWGARSTDIQRLRDGIRKDGNPVPIATIGDLATYTAGGEAGFERRISDYRGLGDAAQERINNALEGFWAWWNNTGREEFAREHGVAQGEAVSPEAGTADAGGGGDGQAGEPAGDPPVGPDNPDGTFDLVPPGPPEAA